MLVDQKSVEKTITEVQEVLRGPYNSQIIAGKITSLSKIAPYLRKLVFVGFRADLEVKLVNQVVRECRKTRDQSTIRKQKELLQECNLFGDRFRPQTHAIESMLVPR